MVKEDVYEEIAIVEIATNPLNPRRSRDPKRFDELVTSILEHGVLQPIIVRPHPRPKPSKEVVYQVVIGEGRFLAASKAGRMTLPAAVRDLDDRSCLELMLVENGQRDDLDPMEEAETYHRLHKEHGMTLGEVADRVGKSTTAVFQRIKLMDLTPPVKRALHAGRLTVSVAELIGRAVHPSQHREALDRLEATDYELAPSYREAKKVVESDFMLRLAGAPWKIDDALLLPDVGSCADCEKRTGNQKELFPEPGSKDLCLDRNCFAAKRTAARDRRLAEAAEAGAEILDGEEAKKVVDRHGRVKSSSGYVALSDPAPAAAGKRLRTLRQVLGKRHQPPVTVVAVPGSEELVEVARKSDVQRGLEAKGLPAKEARRAVPPSEEAIRKKKARYERAVYDAQVAHLVECVSKFQSPLIFHEGVLREITREVYESAIQDAAEATRRRRGLPSTPVVNDAPIRDLIKLGKAGEVLALLLELLAQRHHPRPWIRADLGFLNAVASFYNVDLKSVATAARLYVRAIERRRSQKTPAKRKARAAKASSKENQ